MDVWRRRVVGIIDTLSAGFDRTARRLWLILLPVLLDLAIWLGPRLSLNRLATQAIALLPDAAEFGSQYAETVDMMRAWLTDAGATTNVMAMLSMRLLGLPTLTDTLAPKALPFGLVQRSVEIRTWLSFAGVALLLTLVSLLLGCFCLSLIAEDARDGGMSLSYALQVAGRSWVRLVTLLLVLALAIIVVGSGVAVVSGLVAVLSVDLAGLLLSLFGWGFLSICTYGAVVFYFTSRAIILDDAGILRSLWNALNVVHRSFLSAIGFILLVSLLQTGLLYIWRMLAVGPAGTLLGVVGNAYVSTGLIMASFIFYRDRYGALQKSAAEKGQG
jgi:hypothetical protein